MWLLDMDLNGLVASNAWGTLIAPLLLSLVVATAKYLVAARSGISTTRLDRSLAAIKSVPETDHAYLEPEYRAALREYLRRSLARQLGFVYRTLSFMKTLTLVSLWFIGIYMLLLLLVHSTQNLVTFANEFAMLFFFYFLFADFEREYFLWRTLRDKNLWVLAAKKYYPKRLKYSPQNVRSTSFGWTGILLIPTILYPAIALPLGHAFDWQVFLAAILWSVIFYISAIWSFRTAFKPGSLRHMYAWYGRSIRAAGFALPPILLFWLASLT